MIDLSKQNFSLYPIKLVDGTILKLKKPTQKLLTKLLELQEAAEQSQDSGIELIGYIFEIVTEIFNRNTASRIFTVEEVEDMLDLEMCMLIVKDYLADTSKSLGE